MCKVYNHRLTSREKGKGEETLQNRGRAGAGKGKEAANEILGGGPGELCGYHGNLSSGCPPPPPVRTMTPLDGRGVRSE